MPRARVCVSSSCRAFSVVALALRFVAQHVPGGYGGAEAPRASLVVAASRVRVVGEHGASERRLQRRCVGAPRLDGDEAESGIIAASVARRSTDASFARAAALKLPLPSSSLLGRGAVLPALPPPPHLLSRRQLRCAVCPRLADSAPLLCLQRSLRLQPQLRLVPQLSPLVHLALPLLPIASMRWRRGLRTATGKRRCAQACASARTAASQHGGGFRDASTPLAQLTFCQGPRASRPAQAGGSGARLFGTVPRQRPRAGPPKTRAPSCACVRRGRRAVRAVASCSRVPVAAALQSCVPRCACAPLRRRCAACGEPAAVRLRRRRAACAQQRRLPVQG